MIRVISSIGIGRGESGVQSGMMKEISKKCVCVCVCVYVYKVALNILTDVCLQYLDVIFA